MATIESFRTGRCNNDYCMMIMQQVMTHCAKHRISFILNYVPSEKNLADAPSRNLTEESVEPLSCLQQINDITADDFYKFFSKPHQHIRHGESTFAFNMVQDRRYAAFAVKCFDKLISEELDYFVNKPIKRWKTASAVAKYIEAFNPPESPHLQKIIDAFSPGKSVRDLR